MTLTAEGSLLGWIVQQLLPLLLSCFVKCGRNQSCNVTIWPRGGAHRQLMKHPSNRLCHHWFVIIPVTVSY